MSASLRAFGIGLLVSGALGGCALIGEPVKKANEPVGPPPPTQEEIYAKAACQNDPARGMVLAKSLLANDPDNVATQLVHAYMVERTGRPVHAWELYNSLADGNYSQSTSLTCNNTLIYSGAVSDVARFRSDWLANVLKTQGVDLSPPPQPEQLLEPEKMDGGSQMVVLPPAFANPEPPQSPPAVPAIPVQKETTMTPKPASGPFVHLASYKGTKTLLRGWKEISNRHKEVLAGYEKTVQTTTLKGKPGKILRLGVHTEDKATAQALCKSLKAARQYCAILK